VCTTWMLLLCKLNSHLHWTVTLLCSGGGQLSGVRCKWFACGPADATATSSSLASLKSRMVLPFLCWLAQLILEKRPLNGCLCVSMDVISMLVEGTNIRQSVSRLRRLFTQQSGWLSKKEGSGWFSLVGTSYLVRFTAFTLVGRQEGHSAF